MTLGISGSETGCGAGGNHPPSDLPRGRRGLGAGRGSGGSWSPRREEGARRAGALTGRRATAPCAQARPAASIHSAPSAAARYYSRAFFFPPPFYLWVSGKGARKAPLSGLQRKSSHTLRKKEEEGRRGEKRDPESLRLGSERLEDTPFPTHPSRKDSRKSESPEVLGTTHSVGGMHLNPLQILRRRPAVTHRRSVLKIQERWRHALLTPRLWRADITFCLRRVRVGVGRWIGDWNGPETRAARTAARQLCSAALQQIKAGVGVGWGAFAS